MNTLRPLRIVSRPTRNHRLNEILGLIVLVGAALLLLALCSYTPADPSLNTVGGYTGGHPAHNWTGLIGASVADAILQILGIAAFFLPLLLVRLGICWMRSRPAGSPVAKITGFLLWIIFAPAAIALFPGHLLIQNALPIAGLVGLVVAGTMIHFLNLPGACIVVALMVALSLYLATTFAFNTASEWMSTHFSLIAKLRERWARKNVARVLTRSADEVDDRQTTQGEHFGSKREKAEAEARHNENREHERLEKEKTLHRESSHSLLGSFFNWFGRRRNDAVIHIVPEVHHHDSVPTSVWQAMPRMDVDAPPVTALSTAAAAAAPYAQALAAAAAPLTLSPPGKNDYDSLPRSASAQRDLLHRSDFDNGEEAVEEPFAFLSSRQVEAEEPLRAIRTPKSKLEEVLPAYAPPAPIASTQSAGEVIAFSKRADADIKPVAITAKSVRGYKLPSSSLLYRSDDQAVVREDALRDEARTLVEKCAEFGVDGQVTQINPGPVVTTFEFRPDAGVKYSRVTGLADDLCLAMAAESILIERMAGKSTVGIQVPNHERETIWLRDVVECESFAQSKSKLAIALGKDINGRIVTADLASMPHVLIAGSTGSGKSVAINAMIMSVLFKSTPEQVRMILVDPKRVELGMYEGIPHLFTPIITEAKLAANALRNAVREMERRLKLLAANHVRNIDQFNKLFDNGSDYLFDDVNQEPLPYIIIIIDELADLMMLDRSNVEESITRLAQMARAVGIHLILATQRPSVDVITGLIKANVPTRMSFRLATKVDSRTIIDSNGAESLLGRGDMLYLPPGTSRLQRVHAPFVTEKEISAVTAFWRAQGEAEYVQGFLEGPKDEKEKGAEGEPSSDDNDELFDDAVRLVFEFGKASTSLLQRRLRIGYGRAAHLIDMMYNDGLVGPADGSKPRELLKSPAFYKEVDAALR